MVDPVTTNTNSVPPFTGKQNSKHLLPGILAFLLLILILVASFRLISRQTTTAPQSGSANQIAIPEDLPQLPAYPGAKFISSNADNPGTDYQLNFQAVWITSDSIDQVMNWYTNQLPKEGWTANVPFKELKTQPGAMMSTWSPTKTSPFVEIIVSPADSNTEIKANYYPNMDVLYPEGEEEEE